MQDSALRQQAFDLARAIDRCEDWRDLASVPGLENPSQRPVLPSPSGNRRRVGMWTSDDMAAAPGTFELTGRPSVAESWAWASTDRIPPKGKLPRVVLIGESVARGYLCEPHWNPARALVELSSAPNPGIEVVDLARSGLQLPSMFELLDQSLLLAPDAVVLLAGNNWAVWDADIEGRKGVGLSAAAVVDFLHTGQPWRVLVDQFDVCVRRQVSLIVGRLATWSRMHGIPIVTVIPEVNAEWRFANESLPMLFAREEAAAWHERLECAVDAIERGDAESAQRIAGQMAAIDQGGSALVSNLLADAAAMTGKMQAKGNCQRSARRTAATLLSPREPCCYPVIQMSLREECETRGLPVVDLPEVFKKQCNGNAPGREFFLDHCHLTIDGIEVAMAAVAAQVRELLRLDIGSGRAQSVDRWSVAKADTRLIAALYHAACLQPREVIAYHCRAALQACPELVSCVPLIAGACISDTPVLIRPSYRALLETQGLSALKFFSQIFPLLAGHAGVLDAVLELKSAAAAVQDSRPNSSVQLDDVVSRGDVCLAPIDLLDKRWIRMGAGDLEVKAALRSTYFRSFRPHTDFQILLSLPVDLVLEVTYRTPDDITCGAAVGFFVNRQLCDTVPASRGWHSATIHIPSRLAQKGINLVRVAWPTGTATAKSEVDRIIKRIRLASRFYPAVLPTVLPGWGDFSRCVIAPSQVV